MVKRSGQHGIDGKFREDKIMESINVVNHIMMQLCDIYVV